MTELPEATRKDKILDAAERAFAESGFEGASLRQIVATAEVNLATVYYYFESKEKLLDAVVQRRFGPMKQGQLDRLQRAKEQAGGRPLPVEAILEIMMSCPLALTVPGSTENQLATRLLGRIISDPNPQIQGILRAGHAQVRGAFVQALHESLPDLPKADLLWRVEFIWGALGFILCNPSWAENRSMAGCEPLDAAKVLPQMIAFFATGLRAPAVTSSDSSHVCI